MNISRREFISVLPALGFSFLQDISAGAGRNYREKCTELIDQIKRVSAKIGSPSEQPGRMYRINSTNAKAETWYELGAKNEKIYTLAISVQSPDGVQTTYIDGSAKTELGQLDEVRVNPPKYASVIDRRGTFPVIETVQTRERPSALKRGDADFTDAERKYHQYVDRLLKTLSLMP